MTPRPAAIIAHMSPIYVDVAAPLAKAYGVPTLLWFAHPAITTTLRIADRSADAILTSLPGAYPLPGPKVHVIGQAIDVDAFAPVPAPAGPPLRLLALGRTSPAKGFPTVIEAVRQLHGADIDVRLRIVGPSTTEEERSHRLELQRFVDRSQLAGIVTLEEGVPRREVDRLIGASHILLNAMVAGSGDKVVFEAMAMERLVIASNPAFSQLLGGLQLDLTFPQGDASALADRIDRAASSAPSTRRAVGDALRARVASDHSIGHWADSVLAIARSLRSGAGMRSRLA
jgi:glycosyltransferase involved in cell wall biosynthesis